MTGERMRTPVLAPPRAAPSRNPERAGALAATPRLPAMELSGRAYLLLVAAVVLAYATLWAAHFHYVYGWVMDDYAVEWTKGLATIRDWRHAFDEWNALQLSFFLITYLPLKLGISLPSYPLPLFGEQTGHFRFLLLYTVFLHAVLLGLWAWFATKLTGDRLAALVSLALFATSPTLTLWSPQPESRLLGLPFALAGLWLLFRMSAPAAPVGGRRIALYFLAGSLLGLAQAIHYTALYLLAPVCLVFWLLRLAHHWRRPSVWREAIVFGLGGVWLHVGIEAVSYFLVGRPWSEGLTMTLAKLRTIHTSPWSTLGNLRILADGFVSQVGVPLLVAIALGWAVYVWGAWRVDAPRRAERLAIGVGVPLGLLYLWLSGTMPFFRQTSGLQPFLFLFASVGMAAAARRLTRLGAGRAAVVAGLLAIVGIVPWSQAAGVFQAEQGLGRALEWAYANKGDHPLRWLPIAWFGGDTEVLQRQELEQAPPDTWLISYYPVLFVDNNPSLQPYLARTPALASWPSLYATDTLRMEHRGYGYNDWRADPLLRAIRVVEVGALRETMRATTLEVQSVTADSQAFPSAEPANVFDHDTGPDGVAAWISAPTPGPHTLTIDLARAAPLGGVDVVLPPVDQTGKTEFKEQSGSRIATLEIQAAAGDEAFQTIWLGRGLENQPVIAAAWPTRSVDRLRLVVDQATLPTQPTNWTSIEEIEFPGYQVSAPPPSRPLPPLELQEVQPSEKGLVVVAQNVTPQTVVRVDGTTLPTRLIGKDRLLGRLSPRLLPNGKDVQVALTDGLRESNALSLAVRRPALTRLYPSSTPAGRAFDLRPDGTSVLTVDSEGAGPETTVLFDSVPLQTAFASERWLQAAVPPDLIARPGRHTVTLRNVLGESDPLAFEVTEPVPLEPFGGPPVEVPPLSGPLPGPLTLDAVMPAKTRVGQTFNRQPDGHAAMALDVENAVRGTVVVFGNVPLATTYGSDHLLTAIVPAELYRTPGSYPIYLKYGDSESNRLEFVVEP